MISLSTWLGVMSTIINTPYVENLWTFMCGWQNGLLNKLQHLSNARLLLAMFLDHLRGRFDILDVFFVFSIKYSLRFPIEVKPNQPRPIVLLFLLVCPCVHPYENWFQLSINIESLWHEILKICKSLNE